MHLHEESHLHGKTIIEHDFPEEYAELTAVLTSADVPLREPGPYQEGRGKPPKRQSRGGKMFLLPADLPSLNKEFDAAFRALDWQPQPYASDKVFALTKDRSRGDFQKNGVFVEVEFGNTASMFRDLFKFQVANRERKGEVAVLVTPVSRLARLHDSGVTTFEKIQGLMPYLAVSIQMPIWVIGLEPESFDSLRIRYGQMAAEAEAHGQLCHSVDDAMRGDFTEDENESGD